MARVLFSQSFDLVIQNKSKRGEPERGGRKRDPGNEVVPSCLSPLFQNRSSHKIFLMKMSSNCIVKIHL